MSDTIENLQGNWNYPTAVRFGVGKAAGIGEACRDLGMRNPLLVTDPGLAGLPMIADAVTSCEKAGLTCGVFSDIKPNPVGQNVDDGADAYKAGNHDGVIAFGGGSGLDAAKAIALLVGQTRPLFDFEDAGDNWTRVIEEGVAPIVAVPTTSGTGSEVGRASVITDEANHVKKIIFHPKMMPSIVVADPALTVGLPAHITAATGMDALSHNLEAYCSPFFHPMAEGIAVEGIRLVKEYLPAAVKDGNDLVARSQMMISSTMGATAFQRGLGGMHALAHPLGALYDAHHGLLNAILMPYVLIRNRSVIEDRMSRLAAYVGLENASFDGVLNWVLDLRQELKIPNDLGALNIDDAKADLVGRMATEDPSAGGNPIQLSADEYKDVFLKAVKGDLS
ncbi:iron-containing alcohol dehydrogenase [Sneathiella aquimaris]|uniref:iron-containing alcohol dehydrogenase n=1 Tax=Sneathiella aquimaris TaxID=2599305 RepID=UPI00146C1B5B|nr:iron-containing alcohol dehydrogenase [Sneathiella aquimaris]